MSVLVQSDVIAVQASISGDDTTSMNTAHPALVETPKTDLLVTFLNNLCAFCIVNLIWLFYPQILTLGIQLRCIFS